MTSGEQERLFPQVAWLLPEELVDLNDGHRSRQLQIDDCYSMMGSRPF